MLPVIKCYLTVKLPLHNVLVHHRVVAHAPISALSQQRQSLASKQPSCSSSGQCTSREEKHLANPVHAATAVVLCKQIIPILPEPAFTVDVPKDMIPGGPKVNTHINYRVSDD
jgi:hypothetical protein